MTNPDAESPEEGGPGDTLNPAESLDSDEVRNDDGDTVVDPPEHWSAATENETLDDRLAEERPDVLDDMEPDDEPSDRAHRGQISGSPEDGDSLYPVVD